MYRTPTLASIGMCLALVAAAPQVVAGEAPGQARSTEVRPELPATARAAQRAEAEVAILLVRLDKTLELRSLPDASPEWPARLAALLESRKDGAPAQELLRGLAVDLRRLGVRTPLGGAPGKARSARPEIHTPEGRARAEAIARIGTRAELVLRKLEGPGESARPRPRSTGGIERIVATANSCPSAEPRFVDSGIIGSTTGATVDGDASCAGPVPTPDVWFRFTAPEDGSYTFLTQLPDFNPFDTVLSLHSGCPTVGGDLLELACSDDAGGDLFSSISRTMSSGEEVWIRVSGYGGATGRYDLRVRQTRTIRGTVTEEGSGAPLGGIEVEVTDRFEDFLFRGTSGLDGTYEVAVHRTPSDLVAHTVDEFHVTEWYDGQDCTYGASCSSPWDADVIDVDEADASGIDFTLIPSGTISGTVTASDGNSGSFLPTVSLYAENGLFLAYVTAEADGAYRFVGLPAGGYRVHATEADYRGQVWEDVPCSSCSILSGEVVQVAAGVTASGIDFTLDRLGSISGTVLREDEGPVSDSRVFLYRSDGTQVGSRFPSAGVYQFSGLEEGDYFVRAESQQFRSEIYDGQVCEPDCDVTTGTPVSVAWSEDVTGIDFRLEWKARISGTVLEEGTEHVVSIPVLLYDETGAFVASAAGPFPSIAGRYDFLGLTAGTYYVKAGYFPGFVEKTHADELWDDVPCPAECDPSTGTPIVLGDTTHVMDIDFRLVPRGTIGGVVTDSATGLPIPNLTVHAYFPNGSEARSGPSQPDGSYEVPYLEAGSYRVGTNAAHWKNEMYDDVPCGAPCDRTQGTPVTVQNGVAISGIDFALDRWGSIAGQVRAPVASTTEGELELFDSTGSLVHNRLVFFNSGSAPFDYLLTGLAAGTYFLKLDEQSSFSSDLQAEVYSDLPCEPGCEGTDGTPILVGEGEQVTGIDFFLAACSHDSLEELVSTTVDDTRKVLACDLIRASDSTVLSGASLTLRSGRAVVLGDGFSVEDGASLQVIIEPDWADE